MVPLMHSPLFRQNLKKQPFIKTDINKQTLDKPKNPKKNI